MTRFLELLTSVLIVVALFVLVGVFLPDRRSMQHSVETSHPLRQSFDTLNSFKGKTVDNAALFEQGYISTPFHAVKIITRGELSQALTVKVAGASKSSQEAIAKAGGSFEKTAVPVRQSAKEVEASEK